LSKKKKKKIGSGFLLSLNGVHEVAYQVVLISPSVQSQSLNPSQSYVFSQTPNTIDLRNRRPHSTFNTRPFLSNLELHCYLWRGYMNCCLPILSKAGPSLSEAVVLELCRWHVELHKMSDNRFRNPCFSFSQRIRWEIAAWLGEIYR